MSSIATARETAKPKRGRPTVFTPEKMQQLLEHMRSGKTMTSWCKSHRFSPSVVFNFMGSEEGESFREKFLRAREEGAYALLDTTVEIADERSQDAMRQKLRVDTRMKIAGMWNRKQFGSRPGDAELNKMTLGELVDAAIAHGKQLAQDAAQPMIDVTPQRDNVQLADASAFVQHVMAPTGADGETTTRVVVSPQQPVKQRTRRTAT